MDLPCEKDCLETVMTREMNPDERWPNEENYVDPAEESFERSCIDGGILPRVNQSIPGRTEVDLYEESRNLADAHITHQLLKFNETFGEIVDKESSSARSLFPFIRSKLNQFALGRRYDEVAILQEVYVRTIRKIYEGREITNHYAWIRSVAFHYIQELNRKNKRHLSLDDSMPEVEAPGNNIDELFLSDEAKKIRRAFLALSPEDQLLLSLKSVQDLSWREIQKIWTERGYGAIDLPALRKRKERALSRLRRSYHTI